MVTVDCECELFSLLKLPDLSDRLAEGEDGCMLISNSATNGINTKCETNNGVCLL